MRFARKRKQDERNEEVRSVACLNCSFAFPADILTCNYCPQCGQDSRTSRIAVSELIREAWGEFVQIDSKLIRTLSALLFKPGFLTCEYMAGKRVRYLSPFKMYLVVAALFFALTSWISNVELAAPLSEAASASNPHNDAARKKLIDSVSKHVSINDSDMNALNLPASLAAYHKEQAALPAGQRDSPRKRFAKERFIRIRSLWETDPAGLFTSVIGFFPNTMFFLLPIYALFLRLLYLRSDWLYVEHLIFALHIHTVFFIINGLCLGLSAPSIHAFMEHLPFGDLVPAALWLSFVVYGFLAARRVYKQGVFKTLVKCWLLVTTYSTVAFAALILTILYALARI